MTGAQIAAAVRNQSTVIPRRSGRDGASRELFRSIRTLFDSISR